ncbi:hypothetical protein SAMN06265365_103329 [Tistlia consotensis]|uniref:Uncharacterized protein n=1 Tax=Tistlia consotensis USBA 355 TaxID=560819 RepID=A0A1Y6C578_9PROT|nr:hypothetical protein [Tistlia consotensis]SMF43772.1 hypothetical protein SAMN05428998_11591 [Tistlia consotensis USBA 355]SNR42899.1 hypothetical protein SAMN06265365_103329 [Tistlia consotensis]
MGAILQSLGDFLASPFRAGHPLARRVGAVLLFKLMVLVLLRVTLFGGGHAAGTLDTARRLTDGSAIVKGASFDD